MGHVHLVFTKKKSKVKKAFLELKEVSPPLEYHMKILKKERVVVEVSLLESLFERPCHHETCKQRMKILDKKTEGGVLSITYTCKQGHSGQGRLSSMLCEKRNQKVFATPTLLSSAVLMSGNNFEKNTLFAKCLNLNFVFQSSFTRIQSLHAIPSIKDLWQRMKEKVWEIYKYDMLVLCGDGRMDCPAFSAKYCLNTMMDQYLNVIIDLEVVDKQEAGGTSTIMEKMGCKRILARRVGVLNLSEVVTDASSVIMKMLREMKGKNIFCSC